MAFTLSAQQYCLTEPFGYGRNATGGTGGTVVTVNSFEALANSLGDYDKTSDGKYRVKGDSEKRIVVITKSITFPYLLNITDCSNKTILALPGVVLSNPTKETQGSGIMYFLGGSNIILRNITFKGPGAEDLNGYDPLCFDGVTNAWVDHCDFSDGIDGNFDNKGDTDNITVSWCRFSYSSASTEHAFTNLVGSSSSDKPSDGRYNITWAYCWWDQGCVERMTRCRNADLHFLNCYWNSSVAKCYIGPENANCYLDGCTMEGSLKTENRFKSYGGTNGLKSVGSVGVPSNTGSVSAPTYAYTALTAAEAKTAVTNASCGAGATLMVTESGVVTSPCASTPCTISFYPNGGAGTMTPQSAYEDITTVLKANTFTRSGYAFQGWATSAGSSTVAYADKASVTPTGNMTLYAVWKVAQTYTLTFNANGGTCGVASLTYTDGGTPLTLPVPTLDGKVCTGWFTAASGGTKIASAGATYTPAATQTLYAQWTDAPPCFVPGTAILGSGTTATLTDGTKVTMESCTVSETNISVGKSIQFEFPKKITAFSFTATCGSDGKTNYYKLNGGSNVALASSTKTAQTYEIPISGEVTSITIVKSGTTPTISEICYTLSGSSSSYTVTYETNGGNSIAQVTGVTKLPNPLPTPTKSGATFDGWYTNAGLTIAAVAGSTINENTTLYAKWTPVATGDVTYTADNSIFPNPERGFYEHIEQTVTTGTNSSNLSDSYFTNGKAAGRSLILRLYYLNNFRETATLTQSVIDLINTDMQKLRDKGFKCILRFAYTNTASDNPSENKDASPAIWQAHLAQLKSTLAANADVIYVVQAGFLGAWGEWYYSSQGKGESIPMATKTNLINQLLDAVPASRVVQLRTPKFKTDYLGSNAALTSAEAYKTTAKARLGHHNDAFLNGDENQGTYENVTADKAYIAQECLYVPVGGETNHDDDASTINTHATGDKAVAEMANLHYSYLNQGYSHAVTDLWRSTGHFDIMSRNLGYRFQLQAGTFSDEAVAGGTMAVNMTLKNVGYAPLYYERPAYIVLKNASNTYSLKLSSDPRSWQPNGATTTINETLTIPASVAPGTYNLYLHLPDASASLAAKPAFAVRFANTDIWESATGYNKLNAQIVVTGSGLPTYVVTFDANGHGTAPTAQTIVENATATEPAALTAAGYTFGGWYKEAACNNKFDFSTPITANTTLYAKWTAIPTYTVTLNGMTNGTVSASKTTGINEGETITLTVTPASGYKLGTISVKDAADNNITLTDNKFTMPASDVTISATFTEISTGGGDKVYYLVSARANMSGGVLVAGADGSNQMLKYDGTTLEKTTDIACDVNSTAGFYYNSTSPKYSDLATLANYSTGSSGTRTIRGIKLAKASTMTITLNSLVVSRILVVYRCASADAGKTLQISGVQMTPNSNNISKEEIVGSFTDKIEVQNLSDKEFNVFVILEAETSSPCTTPTISWTTAPADGEVGDADITLGVNKGLSTGAVTYTSSNPAVATVVDGKLHYVASGSTTITATVAADAIYCEATLTETIDVTCAAPANPLTITATPTVITMGETSNIAVTGGNGGEVTYSVAPATASVSAGVFNASAAGTYVITATQAEYNGECGGTATATIQVNEVLLPTYTLSYVLNGHGTAIADATVSALPNPLPTPSETGWTFDGWYTDNTLTTPATPGAIINANTTLYAKWTEEIVGTCMEIIKATPTGKTTATVSGTLAGNAYFNGQDSYKLGSNGHYIGVALKTGEVFQAGDKLIVDVAVTNNASKLYLYSDAGTTHLVTLDCSLIVGENEFALPIEAVGQNQLYIYRVDSKCNPQLNSFAVCRPTTLYDITTDPTIVNGTVSVVDEAVAGTTVTLTATPSTGYILDSWTVRDAADNVITVTDNKFTMPASDVTVSATFRLIRTYTVKFEGNGATGGAMTDQTGIQEGVATPLTANAFTNGTKIFNGWNTMSDGSGTAYVDGASVTLTDVNTTLTLYAQWKDPATYTVSFSLNGKTGTTPTAVTVTEGEKITKPTPDPEVAGYTFGGWYKEPACTNAWNFDADIVTNTTTLYAKWTKDGTLGCNTHIFFANNADATTAGITNTTRFSGTSTGSSGVSGTIEIDGTTYTVTGRNGSAKHVVSFTVSAGSSATFYLLAKSSSSEARTLTLKKDGILVSTIETGASELKVIEVDGLTEGSYSLGEATGNWQYSLLALHECQLLQYNITYLPATNGTISGATSAAQGMEVTLTATPDAGYILDNVDVYKSDDPTVKVTPTGNQFTMPAYDVTVAPTFRAAEIITITYDANGGQGTMASQTVTEGQIITLSTNTFTHDDPTATFAGWNTKADGTGVAYTDGQAVALVGNTTLYAQWNFGPCFSMEFLTSGSVTSQTYLGDAHAVIKQGVVFYDRVEEGKTMDINADGAKFNSKDDYLKVTLGDRVALAAGTKITVTIHVGGNNRGVAILASDKTTKIAELNKTDGTGGEATLTYTITDPTFNENIFYITRSTDNTSYLKSIIIENCGDYCPEFVPNVTIDYTKFCSTSPQMVDIKVDDFTMGAKLRLFKSGEALALAEVTVAGSEYVFTDIEAVVGDVYYVEAEHTCVVTSESVTISEQALTITPLAEGWYIKDGRIAPDIALFEVKGVADTWTVTTSPALSGATYTLGTDGIVRMSGELDINAPQVYVFTLKVDNGCVSTPVTSSLSMNGQVATTKPTLAFVTIGTKDAADATGESGFTQGIKSDQSTNLDLYKYLLHPDPSDPNSGFNITAVNAYATADEAKIRAYYSQFDLVLVTDYPDTNEDGDAKKSYINALGTLLDLIPILSMETFLAKQPNWQINSTPTDPEVKQDKMTLLCPSHDVFADIGLGAGDIVQMFTTMGEKGMQGFVPLTAPDYMFIATIDGGSKGDLITCCERQVEVKARMIMLGLNYTSMESITNDGKKIVNQMLHYLLRKNADDVADCSMTFTNGQKDDGTTVAGSGDYLWSNPNNWGPTYNMIPTPYHNVRIEKKCIVDVPNAHASLIKLRKDATTVPINPKDGSVIINANGGLTVVGKMVEVRGKNFITTYPTQAKDVYIKADATGNGALAIGGNEGDVNATVDFYSKARDAGEENPVWQYVGAPFSDMNNAIDYYRLAWMCRWTEEVHGLGANWEWVRNEDNMQPFRGYCITHVDNTKTYTFTGKLNASTNRVIQLTANGDTEYKGWNLIANSWMAPLQIDKMKTSDFGAGADAALYIYNTGSYADWEAHKGVYKNQQYAPAGQYTTVPVGAVKILNEAGNADLPSTIAPMQAFFVLTTANTVLQLNHDNLLFNENYTQTTSPMRAPRRAKVQNEDVNVLRIDVKGEYAADKMWIMQADSFSLAYDNGYDGKKILGDAFVPQLAVATEAGEMAIAALPQYEGTRLMFRKGSEDELYTLSFQYAGTPLLLRDLITGEEVEIITGNTYAFYATNEQLAERFEIVKKPESQGGVTTGLTAVVDDDGLHIGNAAGLPLMLSVYTPDGRLIQQHKTAEMNYTLNLPMTGAYIVRLQSANECKIVKVIR